MTDAMDAYIEGFRRREAAERRRDSAQREHARGLLPEIVRALVEEFGARRVVLFGSLARGDFAKGSDIDLLVTGVPPERYWQADARVRRIAGTITVDVVPEENAWELARDMAGREGEVLYDAR